mgnify:CR=1 FL=1
MTMTADKMQIGERTELAHEPVPGYPTALWAVLIVAVIHLAGVFIWSVGG